MRDNKLYKVLRIVFLTLAILSLVFSLAKKVGLAAESSTVSDFPLPFGLNSGYGITEEQKAVLSTLDFDSLMQQTNEVRQGQSPYGYNTVGLYSWTSADNFAIAFYHTDFNFTSNSGVISGNTKITIGDGTANTITATIRYSNGSWNYWYGNEWGAQINIGAAISDGVLQSGVFIPFYPIYSSSTQLVDTSNFVLFSYSSGGHGGGGELADPTIDWGAIDEVLNTTQLIADTVDSTWDNFTFWQRILVTLTNGFNNFVHVGQWLLNNLLSFFKPVFDSILNVLQWLVSFFNNLFSALTTFFESILDFVENGFQSVVTAINNFSSSVVNLFSSITSSISGFFSDLFDDIRGFFAHLHEIYEWFYNHGLNSDHEWSFIVLFHYLFDFDTQTALSDFQSNKYGDFILDIRDSFNDIYTQLTSVTASDRVFFTIQLGNHFGVQIPDIEISFDWYASIRDRFLPYLFAFIYVGAAWLFFKRLPDIIRGVASAESSFIDSLPVDRPDLDTSTITHVASGTFYSEGHISGDGRRREYKNWFVPK